MADQKEIRVVWKQAMSFDGKDSRGFTIPMGDAPEGSSPMELLLIALGGCTAMDIIMILEKKRQVVHGFEVIVSGTRAEKNPRVYTHINIVYLLRGSEIDPAAVESAIQLSEEKYCSVMGTINQCVKIESSYHIEIADNC